MIALKEIHEIIYQTWNTSSENDFIICSKKIRNGRIKILIDIVFISNNHSSRRIFSLKSLFIFSDYY